MLIPALAVVAALLVAGAVLLLRAPVLMVNDSSLSLLFGTSQVKSKQAEISLKLFCRFIPVMVSEQAGPDIIVAAVSAVSTSPRAVIFPYHYAAAAHRYKDEQPDILVIVLGERQNSGWQTDGPLYISTDRQADFFRAGICAAFLASDSEGTIAVFHDKNLEFGLLQAFERGLLAHGVSKNPLYIENNIENTLEYEEWEDISCAVVTGPGSPVFESNRNIPIILFSWMEPGMTPENVKVVFSDSPWSQAAAAVKNAKNEDISLASALIMPAKRIPGKGALNREIVRAANDTGKSEKR